MDENAFIEILIWIVSPGVRASQHRYKYRLAYIQHGHCVIRYDNEAGKGDHKHIGATEFSIHFSSIEQIINDFFQDVQSVRGA